MKVLVIAYAKNGQINDNLANVLTAAEKLAEKCDILIIGAAKLEQISQTAIVTKILHFATVGEESSQATNLALAISEVVKNYTHVLCAADSYGKDLLPRVAGILEVSQISEVIAVISPNVFKKPMYAGNVIAEIESFEEIKLLTIRPTSFAKYSLIAGDAQVEQLAEPKTLDSGVNYIGENLIHNETVDLAHARLIVSGGRSLGSKEAFNELINGLAIKLGAAVGASRSAVEAGYAPNDCQIGQTGKVVAPELYIAIGLSGAVQHIAGMKDSKTVIAINLDPNAQIFEYADYGLVADLFDVVPELIKNIY